MIFPCEVFEAQTQLSTERGASQGLKYLRLEAAKYFQAKSWPNRRDENWKYTSVSTLAEKKWQYGLAQVDLELARKMFQSLALAHDLSSFYRIVYFCGTIVPELSDLAGLEKAKIKWCDLNEGLNRGLVTSESVSQLTDSLDAINLSFLHQGGVLEIPKGLALDKPILIMHLESSKGTGNTTSQCRTLVHLGVGAKVQIGEVFIGDTSQTHWANPTTEIRVSAQAELSWLTDIHAWNSQRTLPEGAPINYYFTSRAHFYLQEQSRIEIMTHSELTHALCRHQVQLFVMGEGVCAKLIGIYKTKNNDHVDHQTLVDFVKGNSTVHQAYYGLLDGSSKAIYNGRVHIRKGSQKAQSDQLNRNMLLSDRAQIFSKPQLEIYADDVKATHGSTVGSISEEEIFYLRSRGISKERAELLLIDAFTAGITANFSSKLLKGLLNGAHPSDT